MHNARPASGARSGYMHIRPSEQVKKQKELVLNDEDFINEFKLN